MTTVRVTWNRKVGKQLDKIPTYLRDKFYAWVIAIERMGISETRKLTAYHDEPLKGIREGERSIRLNKAYRVIYIEIAEHSNLEIKILKVSKHEY